MLADSCVNSTGATIPFFFFFPFFFPIVKSTLRIVDETKNREGDKPIVRWFKHVAFSFSFFFSLSLEHKWFVIFDDFYRAGNKSGLGSTDFSEAVFHRYGKRNDAVKLINDAVIDRRRSSRNFNRFHDSLRQSCDDKSRSLSLSPFRIISMDTMYMESR